MVRRAIILILAASACGPTERTKPQRPRDDKARVFGDASLVPTREGERIRREVALAGEIEGLLEPLIAPGQTRANVDLEPTPPRVLISLIVPSGETEAEMLQHYAVEVATGVVGPKAEVDVVVQSGPAEEPARGPAFPVLLALALLGLGSSAGIALERFRERRKG